MLILKNTNLTLEKDVIDRVCNLGINKHNLYKKTHRGCRAGVKIGKPKQISVLISSRQNVNINRDVNLINGNNLTYIKAFKQASSNHLIKFGLLNVHSVKNKSEIIQDLIIEKRLDFMALTETWLSNNDERDIIYSLTPNGYSFHHCPRTSGVGGGVGIIIKNQMKAKELKCKKYITFENKEIIIKLQAKSLLISVIYRPPPSNTNGFTFREFYNEFSDYLSYLSVLPESVLIVGDFNIHMDNTKCNKVEEIQSLLDNLNLVQLVNEATHNKGHILDLMIVKENDSLFGQPTVSNHGISDHFVIYNTLYDNKPDPIVQTSFFRNIKDINQDQFSKDMKNIVFDGENLDTLVDSYNTNLRKLLNVHAPEQKKEVVIRPNTAWFNSRLRHAKVLKRRLERKWMKSGLESDKNAYLQQCHTYRKLISEVKTEFYSIKVVEAASDKKKLFNLAKTLLGEESQQILPDAKSDHILANTFNEFFINKVVKIRNTITNSATPDDISTAHQTLFPASNATFGEFNKATEEEVRQIIAKSSSATCNQDPIPTNLLKQNVDAVIPIITKIINKSLEDGIFPTKLKHAYISPLLKKANLDKDVLKNYRPVSNLAYISKIIEQVVCKRLKSHLDSNKLWCKLQSAYRAFHSTETALLRVENDILCSIENKKMVALVLLDLSAAFDTIDHAKLLNRLKSRFGLCGTVLNWFKSYLCERSQSVQINGSSSDNITLRFGVPQGSVLGPILFTLYMSPLSDIANQHGVSNMYYADDSQLYLAFDPKKDLSMSISCLELCVKEVRQWLQNNMLMLNDEKTEVILLGSRHHLKQNPSIDITVGNSNITSVHCVRNLGAYFDSIMSMNQFISNKCKSIQNQLRKIYRIRKYLDKHSCISLIQALVVSRLDYANCLLGGINKKYINSLQRMQNSAARLIMRLKYSDHVSQARKELHWLPVNYRIEFRILVLVYMCLNNMAPEYLIELLTVYQPTKFTRASGVIKLTPPVQIPKTKSGSRAFVNLAPELWNSLPAYIRESNTKNQFKKLLKTFYFKLAYDL